MGGAAFEFFYSEYHDRIFKYILKRTSDYHTAEDLTSEVFLSCLENYSRYDPAKASLGTWVYTIAENKLKNHYRSRRSFAELTERTVIVDDMEDILVQAQYLDYLRDRLADAMETLNETQQRVIYLQYFKQKTSSQIAAETGLTAVNVRAVSSRAVKKLKDYFVRHNIDY